MQLSGWARFGLLSSWLVASTIGCGSDSESGGPQSYVGEMQKVMITAAEGGTVDAGAVKLSVPAGALEEDTEISVSVVDKAGHPSSADIAIDVYEFGPDGTTFKMPVELEFDLAGVDMSGKEAKVAWRQEGDWQYIPDSAVQGGKITATTTHFTAFTVILVVKDDGTVGQVGGQCGGDFTACGGDITGTWEYSGSCVSFPDDAFGGSGEDNPFADCTEPPTVSFSLDISGDVTFGSDGSFAANQTTQVTGGYSIPNSCLEELGATCDQVGGTPDGDACLAGGDEEEPELDMTTGTYTTDGGTLVVVSDDDTGEPDEDAGATTYCVRGDTLTVHFENSDGSVVEYTATRR